MSCKQHRLPTTTPTTLPKAGHHPGCIACDADLQVANIHQHTVHRAYCLVVLSKRYFFSRMGDPSARRYAG